MYSAFGYTKIVEIFKPTKLCRCDASHHHFDDDAGILYCVVLHELSDKMFRFVFMVKSPSRILMHAIKGVGAVVVCCWWSNHIVVLVILLARTSNNGYMEY